MKISFCIPSLNRGDYLIKAIKSICVNEKHSKEFEVCIFNNCSDQSYELVEKEIENLSRSFNIKYKKSDTRLAIDLSMLSVMKLAIGDYFFLIGDDDFLEPGGLEEILRLIATDNFDLAIFNATLINEVRNTTAELIGYKNRRYTDLGRALVELKQYCAYSNLLIKGKHIRFDDFEYLIGTSHAYGCFWIRFLKDYENGINPVIIIPEASVVSMHVVEKNYNLLEVVFEHANYEHKLYYKLVGVKSAKILKEFESDFWKKQTSLRQLVLFEVMGHDIYDIKKYDPKLYETVYLKIRFAKLLSKIVKPNKKRIKKVMQFFRSGK